MAAITVQEGITPTNVWPVTVDISTADPGLSATGVPVSPTHTVSQTISPAATSALDSIYFTYSTAAASAVGSFAIRVQQVPGGSGVQTYTQGTNLLASSTFAFSLANTSGAVRIMKLTFTGTDRISLTSGATYAIEITSSSSTVSLYRRASDSYTGGNAYDNRSAINYPNTRDMAMGVVVSGDSQAPTAPTNLAATAISSSRIDLTWSASSDNVAVTGYKIFRGGTQIDTTTSTNYSNTGLTANTAYSYNVSAYDAAANDSTQSTSASATTLSGGGGGGNVAVTENISPATAWPETATISSAEPSSAATGVTCNTSTIVSQTFTPAAAFNLGTLYFSYSTSAASAANSFTLKIQQVSGGAGVQTYSQDTNLFGATPITFSLASTGGATRLLKFEFTGAYQVALAAGTTYSIEISSAASTMNFFRVASNPYAGGAVYTNRSAVNYPSTRDLAMAVVAAGSSTQDSDSDGMPNSWEITYGLNPNSAADASLDPDGDGRTNLQEYQMGSNPNVFDGSTNTVAISVDTANAYELEGTTGRFQITRSGGTNALTINFTRSGIAGTNDYAAKASDGTTLSGSVNLPAGANTAYVVIHPTSDTLNEYPESATVTLASGSNYTIGSSSSATVTVNDAADVPGNEQVFVAPLTPYTGVTSSASGVGTFYLNGPKNRARVSLSFNGLSSTQTNAYIRYGSTGTELRPNLGTGQLTDVIWNIVPATPYSGQQIIDALYQVGGNFVYTNIGTVNYPSGEIKGNWVKETTGGAYPPPNPPAITALTGESLNREVTRFLTQATFGPTKAEVDALVTSINTTYGGDRIAAFNAWIDTQLNYDQTKLEDYVRAVNKREWTLSGLDPNTPTSPAYPANNGIRHAWWLTAIRSRDQLRQRFSFAASEIFVVSAMDFIIFLQKYGTANYYDMLGSYATGNYRDMLESVSKHPIMGQYLSSLKNQKAILDAQGNPIVSPDENYAREIMQLFSIGLVQRRMDGVIQENSQGMALQTYNNADIQNLARVFTGWAFGKTVGPAPTYAVVDNTNFFMSGNGKAEGFYSNHFIYPMANFSAYHDTGAKTVVGTTIPAGLNGEADLDAAHNILFNHPSTAPFISRLLIQRFVTSNPSPGYIYRVAKKFENNGSGVRGDMKAVIKAILLDYDARTLSVAASNSFGKQKEPMVRFAHLMRAFDGKSQLPLTNISSYGYPATQLDNFPAGVTHYCFNDSKNELVQSPHLAPSVFNWFLPDYTPGGDVAQAGLVAPEMQITTETSVIAAINYQRGLLISTNLSPGDNLYGITDATLDDIIMDLSPVVTVYDNARTAGQTVPQATATALDYIDSLLMAGSLKAAYSAAPTPNPRSIIIDAVGGMSISTSLDRMRELLYLVVNTPNYLHQK